MYSIMPIMSFVMAINGPVAMAGSLCYPYEAEDYPVS